MSELQAERKLSGDVDTESGGEVDSKSETKLEEEFAMDAAKAIAIRDAINAGRSLDTRGEDREGGGGGGAGGDSQRPRSPIALLEKGILYPFAELPLPRNHLDVGRRMRELQRSVHTTLDKFVYKFVQSAEKEQDIKHRWKSMRIQIEELRNNVNISMEKLLNAVVDRDAEVNALKHTITVLQRQLRESEANLRQEKERTMMCDRIFEHGPLNQTLEEKMAAGKSNKRRAVLRFASNNRKRVYELCEEARTFNRAEGSCILMTCCRHCGMFFVESEAEWPCPCEHSQNREHELFDGKVPKPVLAAAALEQSGGKEGIGLGDGEGLER